MKLIYKNILFLIFLIGIIIIIILNNNHKNAYFTSEKYTNLEVIETEKDDTNILEKIDKIFFINLKHRKDRYQQINDEFKKMDFPKNKIERIDAVNAKYNGHIGCCKSHIKTLNNILENNYKYSLVFEDDFIFTVDKKTFNDKLTTFFKNYSNNWDIIQLTSGHKTLEDINDRDIKRVKSATTSSAYLINNDFVPKLLDDFKEALGKMKIEMNEYKQNNYMLKKRNTAFALDQHWSSLQAKSKWYIFDPYLGEQGGLAGKSSIMNKHIEGFTGKYKIYSKI